jgi:hypothetical protein
MSEEQINIKIVQTVEKFLVIYDYSSLGHSNKEEVDKAWHSVLKEWCNIHRRSIMNYAQCVTPLLTLLTMIGRVYWRWTEQDLEALRESFALIFSSQLRCTVRYKNRRE